jgi:hypothetical protein
MTKITMDSVRGAQYGLYEVQGEYLTQRGWKHKCDLPGALWLWEKLYNNRMIACPTDTAISIQQAMDDL